MKSKRRRAAILGAACLGALLAATAAADDSVDLVTSSQSICVVLANLDAGLEHRLVRIAADGAETLLIDSPITAAMLDDNGAYVYPDLCPPPGLNTYRLYRRENGSWIEYDGSGASATAQSNGYACNDGAGVCDGAASDAMFSTEGGGLTVAFGCSAAPGAKSRELAWALAAPLLLALFWARRRRA